MGDEARFREAIKAVHQERDEHGVDINGKRYSMVKDRVELFRKIFGSEYCIRTAIDYDRGFVHGEVIVATAQVTDREGCVLASGHSMERIDNGNDISYLAAVQSAETSAIGRALACFGLHGGEFASDNEMANMQRGPEPRIPLHSGTPRQDTSSLMGQTVAPPPTQPDDNFFVPVFGGEADLSDDAYGGVIDCLEELETLDQTSKYFAALLPYREQLYNADPDSAAALKATFSSKIHQLGGKANAA